MKYNTVIDSLADITSLFVNETMPISTPESKNSLTYYYLKIKKIYIILDNAYFQTEILPCVNGYKNIVGRVPKMRWQNRRHEDKLIPRIHIYMTTNFPAFGHTLS